MTIMRLCIYVGLTLFMGTLGACRQEVGTPGQTEEASFVGESAGKSTSIADLIANFKDSRNKEVMVVAHRGDWRNAPENSLQAIENCIAMGVDMVEIDIRKTKDGQLILMHDETVDRTTTGTGKVADLMWAYLQTLYLRDGIGHKTPHQIPTLKEALQLCKGNILVNLDKSYPIFDKCFNVIEETGTQEQVVIKGAIPYSRVKEEFGPYLDKVFFMPIVRLHEPHSKDIVDTYLDSLQPVAFEFTVPQDTLKMIEYFDDIRARGSSVWVNALWPRHNGGHDDEKAAMDPTVYDWFLDNHIDMIQTDRPKLLLAYLRDKNRHK